MNNNASGKKSSRIRGWLGEMSLGQQLVALIAITLLVSSFFFMAYLRANANKIVAREMASDMAHDQERILWEYRNHPEQLEQIWQSEDIGHLLVMDDAPYMYVGGVELQEELSSVWETVRTQHPLPGGMVRIGSQEYYCLATRVDDSLIIVSFTDRQESAALSTGIFNDITNVTGFYAAAVLLVLFYWVSSLIYPLNQIKVYVEKVKKGEEATLEIDRSDEIGEVANAIVDMYQEIQHQDQVKEEMIHNISHDLKTPIATIRSYAESIKDGIYPYGSLDSSVDVIIENASRLDSKVHSLLFLNRLDYLLSSSERQMHSIDMTAIINTVMRSMSQIRPEIEMLPDVKPAVFRGEEESWRILVENLVDNALRYAKSKIVVELRPGSLSVSNDGPQIPEDQMKKLFRPFEKGTNGKFGLGLSICSKVAEAYGYSIAARNTDDGVTFTVADRTPVPDRKGLKKKEKERETVKKERSRAARKDEKK